MESSKLFDLTGKVALLTGASKGIGLAMAEGLAEHGCRVMVSSRKLEQCQVAAEQINSRCGEKRAFAKDCNASHKQDLQALVDATRKEIGPIDILVANAASNPYYGPMSKLPDEAYDKIMSTNVKSNHWLAHMVSSDMIAKGSGSIMITSSVGAFRSSAVLGTYVISKLAVLGLVRNLAEELGPSGIRANAICPGLIKTDFSKALWENAESAGYAASNIPLGRLGESEDLKGAAVFLASDASQYITGQALTVCGGSSMWS